MKKWFFVILVAVSLSLTIHASLLFVPGGQVGTGAGNMPYSGTSWTVAFWIKLASTTTNQAIIVWDNSSGTQTRIWANYRGDTTHKFVWLCGGADVITSTTAISDTNWHHIAYSQSAANSWVLYIDGTQDATSSTSCTPSSAGTNGLRFGKHQSNNFPLSGRLAEVGIWSTPLSAAEISALAKGTSPNFFRVNNLLLYMPLYRRSTSGVTTVEIQPDLSGHQVANGNMLVNTSTGDVQTADHCPCRTPAGTN